MSDLLHMFGVFLKLLFFGASSLAFTSVILELWRGDKSIFLSIAVVLVVGLICIFLWPGAPGEAFLGHRVAILVSQSSGFVAGALLMAAVRNID